MQVAILGVGAIGGVIGGYLARDARDITLIDAWPANVDHINDAGLTVTAPDEEFTAKAKALHLGEVSASGLEFDAVILAVKSYDTEWCVKFIESYLKPGGFIISAQNGINDDAIAGIIGWTREVGCVVTLGAGMYGPGHAERTSAPDRPSFTVGEPSGMVTPRLESLVELLGVIGPTKTTTNLWGERWSKLAINAMSNAVAGFTGLGSVELRHNPATRDLSLRIGAELVTVADAWGVNVEPIWGTPAAWFPEALHDGARREEVEQGMIETAKGLGAGRPSLLQDVIKGRRTEVDHLNGYVARKGEEVGMPTPLNESVVKLTKRIESGELQPSLSNLEYID